MTIRNVYDVSEWFEVLQTTERSQPAVMILGAGRISSEKMNVHEKSDQVLLVMEGAVRAEVDGEMRIMRKGDVCVVPAGTPHRFESLEEGRAVTFNVYSPPEYPPGEKG